MHRTHVSSIGMSIAIAMAASCGRQAPPPPPAPAAAPAAPATAPSGPVEVRLSAEARARAGIELVAPTRFTGVLPLRVPGTVAPNAYGQTRVMSLVAGRITAVPVELGTRVRAGDILARITSPDYADAQAAYLQHVVALEADHQRILRLERVVEIGAASRQDLDDARAMHASHASDVERARSRLLLLGFTAADMDDLTSTNAVRSEYAIRAPGDGVITARDVNPGQVVAADAPLLQVSRLDRVWIVAAAYAQDASRLGAGMPARVRTPGATGPPFAAAVSYIDPQVDPSTRAVQVRLDAANPSDTLRFGMLVDVEFDLPAPAGELGVPAQAIQTIGDIAVVYLQDPTRPDVLIERPITPGTTIDGVTLVTSGLADTDRVVSNGSFAVRAERLRTQPAGRSAGRGQ